MAWVLSWGILVLVIGFGGAIGTCYGRAWVDPGVVVGKKSIATNCTSLLSLSTG